MFKYFWIIGLVFLFVILIVLTCCAVGDILKNDMHEGDTVFDFIENFTEDYPVLFAVWMISFVLLVIISLICWIISKSG